MQLKRLSIQNFKSIVNVVVDFDDLTLFVGANASGKSNIISVLRFISNILSCGLDNAIAQQGGTKFISNASLPIGTPIRIEFELVFDNAEQYLVNTVRRGIEVIPAKLDYVFEITPNRKGQGYHITYDSLSIHFICKYGTATSEQKSSDYDVKYIRKSNQARVTKESEHLSEKIPSLSLSDISLDAGVKYYEYIANSRRKELMLSSITFIIPSLALRTDLLRIYDFDPKQLKKSSSIISSKTLAEDGSNMASVLQTLLKSKRTRESLTLLLKSILPFISDISVENNLDQSVSYKIKEQYSKHAFYANFLSDGTVSIVAVIIALCFENQSPIIILEEPERNIHPQLLRKLLEIMNSVLTHKQIILTTHNPEVLKHSDIHKLRFVQRSSEGFTIVTKPSDSESVKCFVQNDLGVEDLFLQDLLGD